MAKKRYALGSNSLICAPGMLLWGINGYKFKKDRKNLLNVFVSGWGGENAPTPEIFDKLLKGEIPYEVEPNEFGGSVVFTVEDNTNATQPKAKRTKRKK